MEMAPLCSDSMEDLMSPAMRPPAFAETAAAVSFEPAPESYSIKVNQYVSHVKSRCNECHTNSRHLASMQSAS